MMSWKSAIWCKFAQRTRAELSWRFLGSGSLQPQRRKSAVWYCYPPLTRARHTHTRGVLGPLNRPCRQQQRQPPAAAARDGSLWRRRGEPWQRQAMCCAHHWTSRWIAPAAPRVGSCCCYSCCCLVGVCFSVVVKKNFKRSSGWSFARRWSGSGRFPVKRRRPWLVLTRLGRPDNLRSPLPDQQYIPTARLDLDHPPFSLSPSP